MKEEHGEQEHKHEFTFTVDREPLTTTEHELTPRQIMEMAEVDPEKHYLEEKQGDHLVSYKDKADQAIHIHMHAEFITQYMGETPVS